MSGHDPWLFIVSGLLLNLTPGSDTLLIADVVPAATVKCGKMQHVSIWMLPGIE